MNQGATSERPKYPVIRDAAHFHEEVQRIVRSLTPQQRQAYEELKTQVQRRRDEVLADQKTIYDNRKVKGGTKLTLKDLEISNKVYNEHYDRLVAFERDVGIHSLGMGLYRTICQQTAKKVKRVSDAR